MNLIYYLLEANLYLAAFYLLYVLLLRSETHYQLNRAYLLLTSAMAFIIPLLQLGVLKPELTHTSIGVVSLDYSPIAATVLPSVMEAPKWNFSDYTLAIYCTITLALFIHLIIKIGKLITLSKKGTAKREDGFVIIELPGENMAFSFFGYLFVNAGLSSSQTILHHEQVHIRQKHSWDIIYLELIKTLNWFNPIVYLLQKSIKEVHEFIADQQVATLENGAADYADFLISSAYGLSQTQLTNSFFNKNLLKRRIIMLYQKKSGKTALLKYLLTLPLLCGLLCASTLAFTKSYGWIDIVPKATLLTGKASVKALNSIPHITNNIKTQVKSIQPLPEPSINTTTPQIAQPKHYPAKHGIDSTIFNTVEVNPQFPGGEQNFIKFLRDNIRYPKVAHDNNISGRVFISFVVETNGSLSGMKILRDPGTGLGDEAMRVMALSPKWTPGMQEGKKVRVQYTVPINFSLSFDADKKDIATLYYTMASIKYPQEAMNKNSTGRVFVSFTLNANKEIRNIKVLRSANPLFDDEVTTTLQNFKTISDGIPGVNYIIPVFFGINDIKNQRTLSPAGCKSYPSDYQPNAKNEIIMSEVVVFGYK
jgi:TonB family protein